MSRNPKIDTDEDYIESPKYSNSLKKLLERYPEGTPISTVCKVLVLKSDEVEKIYKRAIMKLRNLLGADE